MENPCYFQSNGQRLLGMIHVPENRIIRKKAGVIFFPAGAKYRVGPHRLYVKLARQLQAHGYPYLRIDTHGIGDSEGDLEYGPINEVWSTIETGRFVDDALAAVDHFCKALKLEQVVLTGLCGGAKRRRGLHRIDGRNRADWRRDSLFAGRVNHEGRRG